ncbi:MAG: LamG domain-containing protein, partial [Victivallales bacterium]|nr:LamG domain-containing protein [Victivallales bacterium]
MKTKTVIWMMAVWLGWTAVSWSDLSFLVPNQEDKPAGLAVDMGGQWATGRFGKAAYLGRQGDSSIHFKDQEAVRVGNSSFSLLMWLCPDTLKTKDANVYRRILLKINKKNEFWVLDVYEDGRLMFSMRDLAGHYASTKSDPVLKAGKWQHVAVVVDREKNTTAYYIDGQSAGVRGHNPELTGSLDVPDAPLIVSTWTGRKFEGLFGSFKIVNRNMDAEEIKQEHKMGEENYVSTERELTARETKLYSPALPNTMAQTMWNMAELSKVPQTYPVEMEPFNSMLND